MSHKKKGNITGYSGVSKSGNRYTARMTILGKYSSLGRFDSPREAAIAYDRAVIKHNLPLYKLNFPNGFGDEKGSTEQLLAPPLELSTFLALSSDKKSGFAKFANDRQKKLKFLFYFC